VANKNTAPTKAPTQKVVETGKGPTPKGKMGHPSQPAQAGEPRKAATTGPKGSQSVNYDAGQDTPANVKHLGASGRDYADQQAQEMQDKGT
jgi:hypothetical protein